MYDEEFNSLLENLKKIVKFKLVRNTKYFNFRNFSYIKISKREDINLIKKILMNHQILKKFLMIFLNSKVNLSILNF